MNKNKKYQKSQASDSPCTIHRDTAQTLVTMGYMLRKQTHKRCHLILNSTLSTLPGARRQASKDASWKEANQRSCFKSWRFWRAMTTNKKRKLFTSSTMLFKAESLSEKWAWKSRAMIWIDYLTTQELSESGPRLGTPVSQAGFSWTGDHEIMPQPWRSQMFAHGQHAN